MHLYYRSKSTKDLYKHNGKNVFAEHNGKWLIMFNVSIDWLLTDNFELISGEHHEHY